MIDVGTANGNDIVPTRRAGLAWLVKDGAHLACFSKYGRTSKDCAPVAWRLAYLFVRETGEQMTYDDLSYAMGLVVNEDESVASIIRDYGHRKYR